LTEDGVMADMATRKTRKGQRMRAAGASGTAAAGRRERLGEALDHLAPRLPRFEREAIIDHALDSPGLSVAAPGNAAWLAMVVYIRHVFTDYDALLAEGFDQDAARFFVIDEINDYLAEWGASRQVEGGE